jgi:hypothetical protein
MNDEEITSVGNNIRDMQKDIDRLSSLCVRLQERIRELTNKNCELWNAIIEQDRKTKVKK